MQSVGKTYEVRRCEAKDGRGREGPMTQAEITRLFLKQSLDRNRWRVGLQPFPAYTPPPAPPTEERKEVGVDWLCFSVLLSGKAVHRTSRSGPTQSESRKMAKPYKEVG